MVARASGTSSGAPARTKSFCMSTTTRAGFASRSSGSSIATCRLPSEPPHAVPIAAPAPHVLVGDSDVLAILPQPRDGTKRRQTLLRPGRSVRPQPRVDRLVEMEEGPGHAMYVHRPPGAVKERRLPVLGQIDPLPRGPAPVSPRRLVIGPCLQIQ